MLEILLIIPLGFLMGFVTSISGGGGVFGVPTLLAFGMPPVNALALNRISDLGFLTGAVPNYIKAKEFDWKMAALASIPLTIGAFAGAMFSVSVPTQFLQGFIMGAIFCGIAFLMYPIKPEAGGKKPNYAAGIPALLVVGFWSGAVAMAGSTFAVIALVLFFNRSFLGGKAIDAVAAVPETIISAIILIMYSTLGGFALPIAMFASSVIGAFIGSKLAILKGSPFIRAGMIAISLVMVGKIVFFDILMVF